MHQLDKIDRKILHELDLNARLPLSQLAKRLGLSRDVANYRMKKLEKEKVIRGFRAFIDASRLGYRMYRVCLKFYAISNKDYIELTDMLASQENVFWVGQTDGFIDIVFGAWFRTASEFNDFYASIIEKFRPVIKQDYVHELLSYSYLDRAHLIDSKAFQRSEIIVGGNREEAIDGKDIEILRMLSTNARTPLIGIANNLRMDSASIIYRIRNLESKGVVAGYKVDLSLKELYRSFYSIKMYLSRFGRRRELIAYLKSKPIVVNFTRAIGSWDVEFDVEVENDGEYHSFIQDVKDRFDFISEISFFRVTKNLKVTNLPRITPQDNHCKA